MGSPVRLWGLGADAGAGVLSCSTSSSDEDDDDDIGSSVEYVSTELRSVTSHVYD